MNISVDVPECDARRGLSFAWEDDFAISVEVVGSAVMISGNAAGLVSLARHLLTLAQEAAPRGSHLHLTAGEELESVVDLVLEKSGA